MKLILFTLILIFSPLSLFAKEIQILNGQERIILTQIYYTEEEISYLKHKKEITMCIDPDWMPFEKIENGKHIGLASDYMDILSFAMGIPIRLIPTAHWEESIAKAKNRECDIFSMVPITEDRKLYMDFSSAYIEAPIVGTTQINKNFIDNIEDITNQRIGIVKSYSIATKLKAKYPNINIIEVNSINDGLNQVKDGKIFAFIDNLITINYEIQKNFLGEIKVSARLDYRLYYRVASRNDEPQLNSIIQKVISKITTKIKHRISHKWVPIETTKQIDYTSFMQIIGLFIVLVVLILFFLVREYRLKREILEFNITLEKRVQEAIEKNKHQEIILFQQNRLAQMGEMISMIAHQWRQPLNETMKEPTQFQS